jgi:hypothetical protein
MWINDWSFPETIKAIEYCVKHIDKLPELDPGCIQSPKHDVDENDRRIKVQQILDELIPLDDQEATPVEEYLKNRGLSLDKTPDDIFFHPNLHYQGPGNSHHPAMVALIRDEEDYVTGLLRTYLTAHGEKAPVPNQKMTLSIWHGTTKGGAIKLFPPTDILAVAEGVETALAVNELSGLPVWATVSAVGMVNIHIPKDISTVCIWFDEDLSKTGENAARKLADRLLEEGKTVKLLRHQIPIPEGEKGIDWLDVLNSIRGQS